MGSEMCIRDRLLLGVYLVGGYCCAAFSVGYMLLFGFSVAPAAGHFLSTLSRVILRSCYSAETTASVPEPAATADEAGMRYTNLRVESLYTACHRRRYHDQHCCCCGCGCCCCCRYRICCDLSLCVSSYVLSFPFSVVLYGLSLIHI